MPRLRPISNPYRHIKRTTEKRSGLETQIGAQLDMDDPDHKTEKEIERIEYTNQLVKKYHADFQLTNGIIIEAKGWWKVADRVKHLCIKAQHPDKDIRFIFSNSRQKIAKGSKTTYAMFCEKHGWKYADKKVPQEWINERVPDAASVQCLPAQIPGVENVPTKPAKKVGTK